MSGSDESLAEATKIDGIGGVIGKPLSAGILVEAVRGALGGSLGFPSQCDGRRERSNTRGRSEPLDDHH
jgi:hypothetical protein